MENIWINCVSILVVIMIIVFWYWFWITGEGIPDTIKESIRNIRDIFEFDESKWMRKWEGWELRRQDIGRFEPLGQGNFGEVFKAELITATKERKICAVKMLKGSATEKDDDDFRSEMNIMKRLHHKNIIKLLGMCTQEPPLWLVIEYASQGNLLDHLKQLQTNNTYNQEILTSYASQISEGLQYLAERRIIHRDIAARNVLVTECGEMKISDFGMARYLSDRLGYYDMNPQSLFARNWMALETLSDGIFSLATDVWSFGVLLWEIFTLGLAPSCFLPDGNLAVIWMVIFLRSGRRLPEPTLASKEIKQLIQWCWMEDPKERPTMLTLMNELSAQRKKMEEIFKHRWTSPNVAGHFQTSGDIFRRRFWIPSYLFRYL